jgi:hypothetical protein
VRIDLRRHCDRLPRDSRNSRRSYVDLHHVHLRRAVEWMASDDRRVPGACRKRASGAASALLQAGRGPRDARRSACPGATRQRLRATVLGSADPRRPVGVVRVARFRARRRGAGSCRRRPWRSRREARRHHDLSRMVASPHRAAPERAAARMEGTHRPTKHTSAGNRRTEARSTTGRESLPPPGQCRSQSVGLAVLRGPSRARHAFLTS